MQRFASIAALLISVVALGVAVYGRGPPPAGAAVTPRDDAQTSPLPDGRLNALEEQLDFLARRMTALERKQNAVPETQDDPGLVPPPAAAELAMQVQELRGQVRDLISADALSTDTGKNALREAVRSVQAEMRTEQRQNWAQRADEAKAEQEQRWKQFTQDAHLTWEQEQALNQRLAQEEQKQQALAAAFRDGQGDPRAARQDLRAARQETNEAMGKLLSEEQLAKFQETRRAERQDFGGRPRN